MPGDRNLAGPETYTRAMRETPRARRRIAALALPAALAALLVVLAVLQYRWTGELGRAEEERTRSSLARAAGGFAIDLDRELGRLFFHFLQAVPAGEPGSRFGGGAPGVGQAGEAGRDPRARLATLAATWRREAPYPELLGRLLLAERDPAGGWQLQAFDEATGRWHPTGWPRELAPLRAELAESLRRERRGDRGWWDLPLSGEVSALVVPLWIHGEGGRWPAPGGEGERMAAGEPGGRPAFGILALDLEAMRGRLLPTLVERHFGGDVDYRVEVRDAAGRAIFARGPPVAGAADVVMPLFRVPFVERLARRERRSEGGRGAGPYDGETSPRGRWVLTVTHPAGSLAAAVARARRRNLTLSSLVLGLLAVAVGLVLVAARRAQLLARRQIELVAGVSHELLTPVAAVRSAGENLAVGVVVDPAKVRAYGELIEREARRLGGLVEQVLTWAGLQARGEPASRQPVDAASLVAAVAASCAGEARRAGVELETEVAPGLPAVIGDRDALERALRNLVENALRHGAEGGWVQVGAAPRAARDGGSPEVVLAVEDRGRGVGADDLPHLFEPFFRGNGIAVPGSGLGLALARQIAEAHGGRVRVAPATPQGARFTIELPGAPA